MVKNNLESETDWLQVIAKCLCYLSLQQTEISKAGMLEKARFLAAFGLSRKDCAAILSTTSKSLAELDRQARNKKGSKSGKKAKKVKK